jgi:uncharacterized membrane protein
LNFKLGKVMGIKKYKSSTNNVLVWSSLFTVAVLLAIALCIVLAMFYNFYESGLSTSTEQWGQVGDYIGGLLNPIIATAALTMLVVSVIIQKKVLTTTEETLDKTMAHYEKKSRADIIHAHVLYTANELDRLLDQRFENKTKVMTSGTEFTTLREAITDFQEDLQPNSDIGLTLHGWLDKIMKNDARVLIDCRRIMSYIFDMNAALEEWIKVEPMEARQFTILHFQKKYYQIALRLTSYFGGDEGKITVFQDV